ncbi:hypothetical protein AMECASPLE_014192 [Ameca splendens]|uniref:Uncharacterized protein n=1 Tax=Ameca splendens TaxID=208324 RepID=A0ABV0Y1F2_9TELE
MPLVQLSLLLQGQWTWLRRHFDLTHILNMNTTQTHTHKQSLIHYSPRLPPVKWNQQLTLMVPFREGDSKIMALPLFFILSTKHNIFLIRLNT